MPERIVRRPVIQGNVCASEGLSTCKRIKDSGLRGEDWPIGSSQRHTDRGRVVGVRPDLVISSFRV